VIYWVMAKTNLLGVEPNIRQSCLRCQAALSSCVVKLRCQAALSSCVVKLRLRRQAALSSSGKLRCQTVTLMISMGTEFS